MRPRHWHRLAFGSMLLLGSVVPNMAWGQLNPDVPGLPPGAAAAQYGLPYSSGAYFAAPGPLPPDSQPYPNVSPYGPYGPGPIHDSTRHENGFWFNKSLSGKRHFYLQADGLFGQYGRPDNTLIGNPNVPLPVRVTLGTGTGGNAGLTAVNLVGIPNSTGGTGVTVNGQGTNNIITPGIDQINGVSSVPGEARYTDSLEDEMRAGGMRLTAGFFNPDHTGMFVSGFFLDEGHQSFHSGRPDVNAQNSATWRILSSVPVYAGVPNSTQEATFGLPQEQAIYNDLFMQVEQSTEANGANVGWYVSPLVDNTSFKLRPVVGARYMQLRENFQYRGGYSGTDYSYTAPGVLAGGGAGNTATNSQIYAPVVSTITDLTLAAVVPPYNPVYTDLRSWSRTHLAGPEVGLRYDFGGDDPDGFRMWGASKFGLLANRTDRQLYSTNLMSAQSILLYDVPINGRNNNNGQGASSDRDATSSVSVMFEQQFQLEAPLFQYVPLLKKVQVLEKAVFSYGYTFTLIGGVHRAGSNIEWNAYPYRPRLLDKRDVYWIGSHNFGVHWTF